jgi:hypothetical protein
MSKNISFHLALCAKGFNQGWGKGFGVEQASCLVGFLYPLVFNQLKEEN